jgi:succinyl-diaminopimelate desuccinylase
MENEVRNGVRKIRDAALDQRIDGWLAAHRDALVGDVVRMVKIRSVKEAALPGLPYGAGPGRAVDEAVAIGKGYGYETENDGYFTVSFLRKGKEERELAILAHIDVVPEGEGWRFDPYGAREENGYILGRGSQDNKGPALAALYVLRLLDGLGIELHHSVRVIWGADEESGMSDVVHYTGTHKNLPAFTLVCDSSFPVCYGEKGILEADLSADIGMDQVLALHGGVASNSVPDSAWIVVKGDAEDIRARLAGYDVVVEADDGGARITAKGVAGHAAYPQNSVNAIGKLAAVVAEAKLLTGEADRAVAFLASALADTDGAGLNIACTDDIQTSTTHVGGYVRFAEGALVQNVNIRYAIHADQDELLRNLRETAEANGFTLGNVENKPPRYDSLDDPKIQLLLQTAREYISPDLEPFIMGGGTHARCFPRAVPYGPFLHPEDSDQPRPYGSAHSVNEAVEIQTLLDAIKIYAVTLIRLDEMLSRDA